MDGFAKQMKNGLLTENPTFVLLLGMCPTLAVSTSVVNGVGMGLAATAVLILSNVFISILRKLIPNQIRIAVYIVIVAGFVTMVDLLMQAYLPDLSKSLGLFIPLIVVNCIILARAESYASRNAPLPSAVDGLSMGLGFTLALTIMSVIREILGAGTLFAGTPFAFHPFGAGYEPALIMILPAGGFLTLGFVIAGVQWLLRKQRVKK